MVDVYLRCVVIWAGPHLRKPLIIVNLDEQPIVTRCNTNLSLQDLAVRCHSFGVVVVGLWWVAVIINVLSLLIWC